MEGGKKRDEKEVSENEGEKDPKIVLDEDAQVDEDRQTAGQEDRSETRGVETSASGLRHENRTSKLLLIVGLKVA